VNPARRDEQIQEELGVSAEAMALLRSSELVDLHVDTFIPMRTSGYDLSKRHHRRLFHGWYYGHLDIPRLLEGGVSGAMWSITTNPFRSAQGRWRAFQRNLETLTGAIAATGGTLKVAKDHAEYLAARKAGAHACLLSIQGGNALAAAPDGPRSIRDQLITRVTLVHLTNSCYGITSSPFALWKKRRGLTPAGREMVERLNEARIFVDLAHINGRGFWDAVEVHDRTQPLIVTHTGISGVKPHWRNIDDLQIKAIADTGGTIGVIFATDFLKTRQTGPGPEMVIDHLAHIIDIAGEDFASIGSDYDGMIVPPVGLRSGHEYPRLVQCMLRRGWSDVRIKKILGGNFLRAFRMIRPG
jgi:membrane dipeptidase